MLTAAHCTAAIGSNPSNLAVIVGEHRIDDNSFTRVDVATITDDPLYNPSNFQYDFSILTLASPVTLSTSVAAACLPGDTSQDYAGQATSPRLF